MDLVTACDAQLALASGNVARAEALALTIRRSDRRCRLRAATALAHGNAAAALAALEDVGSTTLRQRLDAAVLRTRALYALRHTDADAALAETVSLAPPGPLRRTDGRHARARHTLVVPPTVRAGAGV